MLNGLASVQFGYDWQDKTFHTTDNGPYRVTAARGLAHARLAWATPDGRFEFFLWGRNLFNERYIVYSSDLSFIGLVGEPRSYCFGISYSD